VGTLNKLMNIASFAGKDKHNLYKRVTVTMLFLKLFPWSK